MFRLFEKILAILTFLPPIYMLYRYCRWYVRSGELPAQPADD